jgi:hypothetical protein
MKTWTKEENEIMGEFFPLLTNEELLKKLPSKSYRSITVRAHRMGLKKTPELRSLMQQKSNNHFSGHSHSEEFCKSQKKHMKEHWENNEHPWIGKIHSEDSKKKMSNSLEKYYETNPGHFTGKNHSEETKKLLHKPHEMSPEGSEAIRKSMMSKPGGGYGNWQEHTCKNGQKVWLQSSYEVRLAVAFDKYDYNWERNTSYGITWADSNGGNHVFYPDFIVYSVEPMFIEAKGEHLMDDPSVILKHRAATDMLGGRFGVACEKEIAEFEKTGVLASLFGVK